MSLIVLDLDLHRFAGLSNIFNFWDVNLYNSLTSQLINGYLGSFLFGKTNSIFHKNFIEIGFVVFPKIQKKHAWFEIIFRDYLRENFRSDKLHFQRRSDSDYAFYAYIFMRSFIRSLERNIIFLHLCLQLDITKKIKMIKEKIQDNTYDWIKRLQF